MSKNHKTNVGNVEMYQVVGSYQREDMLVGPSCEDPCLVTEMEPPAQQAAPIRVPVVVVVDDAGETKRHVAKEGRVLHHV